VKPTLRRKDEFPIQNYFLEVNVENNTDNILIVTTKDFVIKDVKTNKPIKQDSDSPIFPPFISTTGEEYYIDFVRLRPKISETIPGEKIHLTCEFSISSAKEDGTFNVVSTCAYSYTKDEIKIEVELAKKIKTWKDDNMTPENINFEIDNWKLLDALRIVKQDSFDFNIKTIGIFTNQELVIKACDILIERVSKFMKLTDTDELVIQKSETTLLNSYDIILENEDYTIGKAIEYILYTKLYETGVFTFCGFLKAHPHNDFSIIRVAYKQPVDTSIVRQHDLDGFISLKNIYENIEKNFLKIVKN
jgi:DNA-directed RNA polymerase subunit L